MEAVQSPPPGGQPPSGGVLKIVVVGAGATGCLTALELAKLGHHVTLIDAGAPGNGSSSRSAACIRQQFGTPSTVRGMRYARYYYDKWQDQIGEVASGRTPLTPSGYLFLHDLRSNPEQVRDKVGVQREAGLGDVKFLTEQQLGARFHDVAPLIVKFATWCPSDGFLNPSMVYTDAVEYMRGMSNVRCFFHYKVEQAEFATGKLCGLVLKSTKKREADRMEMQVPADVVVNATNAWTNRFNELLDASQLPVLARQRHLVHFKVTDSTAHLLQLPMTIGPNGAYVRPGSGVEGSGRMSTVRGELIAGWLDHKPGIRHPTFEGQDTCSRDHRERYMRWVYEELCSFLPYMRELNPNGNNVSVTSGYYADTPDHNPVIDWDHKVPGLIHAVGFSGHGLMHAPFTARIVCALVQARASLDSITLPGDFGRVDVTPYHANRAFVGGEGMVI